MLLVAIFFAITINAHQDHLEAEAEQQALMKINQPIAYVCDISSACA